VTTGIVGPREPFELGLVAPRPQLVFRDEAGRRWPAHVFRFDRPLRAIASGPYGGGLGERHWVLNATVSRDYDRPDPDAHIAELADRLGLTGPGTGMLTAVDVNHATAATIGGVSVVATVGLGYLTRAADPEPADPEPADSESDGGDPAATGAETGAEPGNTTTAQTNRTVGTDPTVRNSLPVGTINIVAFLPVPLTDAALVNAVATATEAKVQALADHGLDATGTATDAVFLACPVPGASGTQPYGGPRSRWGWPLARAVHAAVLDGTRRWHERASVVNHRQG
jgi:adenosylcobinamide hydrolase